MKKTGLLTMVFAVGFIFVAANAGMADSENFAVSANVPFASGVTFTVTEISAAGVWSDTHPANLDFGKLGYDSTYKIFRPTKYFAIDIGVALGGAGKPDSVQFEYADLANPNEEAANGLGGLGKKATLQVVKAKLVGADTIVGDKVLLSGAASLGTLSKTNFVDGWPRAYVGLYDGVDATLNAAGWEVFTADDAPGDYMGNLKITAVVK